MSNESVAECLSHKDLRHVQVRLDYMQLYRNETKAKIIRILETWTNQKYADWYKSSLDSKEQKQAPPEEDLWITMSYEQFSLFAYGTIKHDTIKQSIDELVSIKHIERRIHPTIPYGPPQYLLNIKEVQKSLDEQEMPSLVDDLELITPHRKKRTPQEKYPQGGGKNTPGDGVKIPPAGGGNSYPSNNTTKNYRDNPKKEESSTPASLSAFAERKKATNPELPAITQEMLTEKVIAPKITLPSKQTPTSQSQVGRTPDAAPSASSADGASIARTGAPAELPAMALTPKQIKQENDRRAKEIWVIIERERHTKYSRTQRELYENSKGMECLLNDEIDDETLVKALGAMDPYQGRNFTLLKFYGWMPNLTAGTGPPSQNGKPAACQDDPTLGISGSPKLHPRRPRYA